MGFEGYISVESYQEGLINTIPDEKGVYLVLDLSDNKSTFMKKNKAGRFKGQNPTVEIEKLEKKWVDNTIVVYIGQAGGGSSTATLKSRIRQLVAFGNGKPVSHWGGRYLWQIKDSKDLVLCWQTTSDSNARTIEHELIHNFISHHGTLPFANIEE